MNFNIQDPLTKLYEEIEELERLGVDSTPFSPEQLVNIGIQIIKRTGDYQIGLEDWYRLHPANRTWPTFKSHFQAARKIMQKVRTKTMQDSSLSVNVIQSKLDTMQRDITTLQENQHTI